MTQLWLGPVSVFPDRLWLSPGAKHGKGIIFHTYQHGQAVLGYRGKEKGEDFSSLLQRMPYPGLGPLKFMILFWIAVWQNKSNKEELKLCIPYCWRARTRQVVIYNPYFLVPLIITFIIRGISFIQFTLIRRLIFMAVWHCYSTKGEILNFMWLLI